MKAAPAAARHVRPGLRSLRSPAAAGAIDGPLAHVPTDAAGRRRNLDRAAAGRRPGHAPGGGLPLKPLPPEAARTGNAPPRRAASRAAAPPPSISTIG